MKSTATLLFCTIVLSVSGQKELIPNGGFEVVTGCPGPSTFLENVMSWEAIDKHFGTPDQFYGDCEYNGLTNLMAPGQDPYKGFGYIGSFCFGSDLREYSSVRFNRPMVKDSTYIVSFYVLPASGYGQAINSYGVHFSENKPKGASKNSLLPLSLVEHVGNDTSKLIRDTLKWTHISGKYKAKGGELYATFGNFLSDAQTKSECLKENCIRADRSYMLLDEVSVLPYDSIYCQPRGEGRDLIVKQEIVLEKRDITIELWDHLKADGDTIDVWIDDTLILENFALSNKIRKIELQLEQGKHIFKIVAVNVGSIPPNTTTVRVLHGNNSNQFKLNSDYETTECLRIVIN